MRLRKLIGFNLLTAVLLGIGGYYLGWWLGHQVNGPSVAYFGDTDQNDIALFLGYLLGVVGFLIGLGFANYPVQRMLGKPSSLREKETEGIGRYFGLCTDHKVVGIQYLIGIGVFIFIGGLNAMLIRFDLLTPNQHLANGNNYLTLVGLHGTMMMGIMSSGILGPFANYLVPVMIGARRMAFPRIEALTFWLLMSAGVILMTSIAFGGFPTGWTGYEPLADQANMGMDAYVAFFALVGLSICLLGLNMVVTIVTMRAPGMSWGRLPIFVWGVFSTATLMLLAAPVLISTLLMVTMDRTAQTTFYDSQAGGSPYLYENLFWFFGHPEVYILALPGFGIVLELLPVFSRKPLWGYRLAVVGMLGVTILSFLVWQHHLFVSGINVDLRPFYMLSTELISLPTGFIFLCALGTLWRGRIRLAVPMLFALAWVFNFLIGGLTGVFLSDVPSDVTTHGSFFSMAHFHYTIMGGLLFAFFGGIYYWVPKMTGFTFNERLAKIHFWVMFIAFNSTFGPLFVIGFLGMPRRAVTYAGYLQGANDWVSVSAFVLGASMLVFVYNLVWSQVFVREATGMNPWHSKSIEWQLPSPVPVHNFDTIPTFGPDPYPYGEVEAAGDSAGHESREADTMSDLARPSTDYSVVEREPPELLARNLKVAAQLWASATLFFFVAFLFAFFYLRSLDKRALWKPKHVDASTTWGTIEIACLVVAVLLLWWGMSDQVADRRPLWRIKGVTALVLGIVAVIAQIVEWAQQSWGPTNGAFASVYLGWTGLYLVFIIGTLFWLEVILAVSFRYRMHAMTNVPVEPGHASGDADRTGQDIADPVTLNTAGLRACTFYFTVLTGIGVISWLLLYLVA